MRSNKLVPLDDRSDFDNKPIRSSDSKSWAITDYSSSNRPRRFEDQTRKKFNQNFIIHKFFFFM